MKMCDYQNHRRFSLRCLGNGIIPVSIRLKNNVRTQRSNCIIQKAERSLLNERIREVNCILDRLEHDTYMYKTKMSALISKDHMAQCIKFIETHKEDRYQMVRDRQIKKYQRLWREKYQSGSTDTDTSSQSGTDKDTCISGRSKQGDKDKIKRWVINLSQKPLSPAQETMFLIFQKKSGRP